MKLFDAVVALFPDLEPSELHGWIEQRWVQPEERAEGGLVFYEVDVARVHLIYDLRRQLETPEETMPLVLSLLDQVYELRRQVKSLKLAIEKLPPDVRMAILAPTQDGESET